MSSDPEHRRDEDVDAGAWARQFDDFLSRGRMPRYADQLSAAELAALLASLDDDERLELLRSLGRAR